MSYCKYQKYVEMKVLDNSFSRIIHISGEILKFTLYTGVYSTVNKMLWFLFSIKKSHACRRRRYMVSQISFLLEFCVLITLLSSGDISLLRCNTIGGKKLLLGLLYFETSRVLLVKTNI